MKKLLGALGVVVLALGVVLVVRALVAGKLPREEAPAAVSLDEDGIARRLAEAIRFETISRRS